MVICKNCQRTTNNKHFCSPVCYHTYPISEETKRKMSQNCLENRYALGHRVSEEARAKMSLSKKGFRHTEEAKRKIGLASLGNQYAKGTDRKALNIRFSAEAKKRMSLSHIGYVMPQAQKDKIRASLSGRGPGNRLGAKLTEEQKAKLRGREPWNKGAKLSDEQKAHLRIKTIENFQDPERRRILSKRMKEKWADPEYRRRMVGTHIDHKVSDAERLRIGECSRLLWQNSEYRQYMHDIKFGQRRSDEFRKKLSEIRKKDWEDPKYRERMIKIMYSERKTGLTIPEKIVNDIIKESNLYFKYVGNRGFWIGGLNPDFVNVPDKKVIEVLGCYFHGCTKCCIKKALPNNSNYRASVFTARGYDTLFIWEHELKDLDSVKQRVLEFTRS